MYKISIKGLASQKLTHLKWDNLDQNLLTQSLLDYLIEQNFPIAYNCYGEGVCEKCILKVNLKEHLSCQIFMKDINDGAIIEVPYL